MLQQISSCIIMSQDQEQCTEKKSCLFPILQQKTAGTKCGDDQTTFNVRKLGPHRERSLSLLLFLTFWLLSYCFHSVSSSSVCQQYQPTKKSRKKSKKSLSMHQYTWALFSVHIFWLGSYFLRENAPSNGRLIETWTNYQNYDTIGEIH